MTSESVTSGRVTDRAGGRGVTVTHSHTLSQSRKDQSHVFKEFIDIKRWHGEESNLGPLGYEPNALSTALPCGCNGKVFYHCFLSLKVPARSLP